MTQFEKIVLILNKKFLLFKLRMLSTARNVGALAVVAGIVGEFCLYDGECSLS